MGHRPRVLLPGPAAGGPFGPVSGRPGDVCWVNGRLHTWRAGQLNSEETQGSTIMGRYQQEYRQSLTEPDQYWRAAAGLIDWYTEPSAVLDRSDPPFYRWFTGGVLNTCFNAVDRHVRDGRAGSPTVPMPGYDVHVVDPSGEDAPPGTNGEIVLRLPLPPGCLPTLWQDDQRFADSYLSAHPGCYLTGDGGCVDADGYLFVMGRTDDVINVAGHRLSTGEMEEVLAGHPAVAECAVIGVSDAIKGQVPRAFVVLKAGVGTDPDALRAELIGLVRDQIGPVAALRQVDVVPALPKTRSGKILRKTMRGIAEGRDEPVPSTIDDPAALDALRPLLLG
jgi:acyl-CoA synthetase (AMP-forming)/AMP-acid ligase II